VVDGASVADEGCRRDGDRRPRGARAARRHHMDRPGRCKYTRMCMPFFPLSIELSLQPRVFFYDLRLHHTVGRKS
jgi:hypothetical protein